MLKGKKILITSGGTRERIDDVRVMTNISTGALGKMIAQKLINPMLPCGMEGYSTAEFPPEVYFVYGKGSFVPSYVTRAHEVESAHDLLNIMKELVPSMDAVIHCMAVSDFTFNRDRPVKCKSNDPEAFIEYMRKTITPNPKIIGKIKIWNPNTILIGFKFEVGASEAELLRLANLSIEQNDCDLVVANDKQEMTALKTHRAHFVFSRKHKELGLTNFIVDGKEKIAQNIYNFIDGTLWTL